MQLLVPYLDEIDPVDARLAALAGFLGITAAHVKLPSWTKRGTALLEETYPSTEWCCVANARVLARWCGSHPGALDSLVSLLSRFPYVFAYAQRADPFDTALTMLLSRGRLCSIREVGQGNLSYDVAPHAEDVCGPFAGLSIPRQSSVKECVFGPPLDSSAGRSLITVSGLPLLALVRRQETEIVFLGSRDVADLDAPVSDSCLTPYFSSLAAPAIALQSIFRAECWRPNGQHACVIVDDPLLRPSYGSLSFQSLLGLMDRHHFHTSIAFIPHNCRRTSPEVTAMFRYRPDRLSLCFHGNDHTGAEFATVNAALLNAMAAMADQRISIHRRITGIECARIMVFPQGKFSAAAMAALKAGGFDAALNSTFRPVHGSSRISLSELIQPAVLAHAGFPLFLRDYSNRTHATEIAFKLFFGRPVFIVEHHHAFRHPAALLAAVARVNAVAPRIDWVGAGEAVRNAYLWKRTADGAYSIRAFSSTVQLVNREASPARFRIEWACATAPTDREAAESSLDLAGGASGTISIAGIQKLAPGRLGLRRAVWGFLRRRLSEFRDNASAGVLS